MLPIPEDDLPKFDKPPVTEVVLAVAFEPLARFDSLAQGDLWRASFRDDYPVAQEQPPYLPPIEVFGDAGRRPPVAIQFGSEGLPPRRLWFLDKGGNRLIQLQQDWFAVNWRRVTGSDTYPQYPELRRTFEESFRRLASFALDSGIGMVTPVQCEVTYVNHIDLTRTSLGHPDADKVLRRITADQGRILGPPEDLQANFRFLMHDGASKNPRGRLHVSFQSAFRTEGGVPIFSLNLTARGAPTSPDLQGVLSFLDLGHTWIVQGFADMTEDAMHRKWERSR